ncbi:S9 family peptidase [Luteimonas salinisoli]|nr:prolyl oligopeptidase family serine peptidase [Luteimonas salinisoli]
MRSTRSLPAAAMLPALLLLAGVPAAAQEGAQVERRHVGNRVTESVPEIPADLLARLNRYQNTRGASVAGWTADGCLLIGTRFAETTQAHRVCEPMGMREQLTFEPERIGLGDIAPAGSGLDGFVYSRDLGGDEFWQLFWYDLGSREATLLTDGARSRNQGALFSRDGGRLAYSSTARNGTDTDVWLMDLATRQARPVVTEGGNWNAEDFSPDGSRMLVTRYVSINESYPGEVDLASGALRMLPVDGEKAGFGGFRYAPDGKGVFYVSDEPVDGAAQEFRTLRYHVPGSAPRIVSGHIPWDVRGFEISDDGRHLAYATNEDGIAKLHLLRLPGLEPVALPDLPVGVFGGASFSPDGGKLALSLNTATSPSDVYVVDIQARSLERWTRSEVGGLPVDGFVEPALVRYPTFDEVDGAARTIPAFYYRPKAPAPAGGYPVVVSIHGGPEGQALPVFNPSFQFLANELGIAVLVPNVRGSSGYGKSYLLLDNAMLREDSVKDIGALLAWIGEQPELDSERIGVSGGSYGGYMVLASLMHYSDRIRAGIDIVGISHFGTFLQNTEDYRRDLRRAEYGDERDPEIAAFFDRVSPLTNAERITTPLFVAQGRNDPRVPYTEAEQIVEAVRGNGQPVWFLMFDDEGHGFAKKSNSDYFGAAAMLFWQRFLLDGEASTGD